MFAHAFRPPALALLVAAFLAASFPTAAQQAVRMAYVDPLSGAFANTGEHGLKHFQFTADEINRKGLAGAFKVEIVGFDNRVSPQETLNQLKKIIDGGIRYVIQGQSSAVALALGDAIEKHNERNPGREILYLNYAAVDPDLTNSKCSYWHFRFDANSDMKMEALTTFLAQNKDIKKVYLINQNYSFGQAVARAAKADLARKRPDIQIVGEDLHALGQVKDFAPYVAKMKAAGADTVITGNWGNDMTLLIKAARDAGLNVTFYTYYAGAIGAITALGEAGVGRVKQITEWHANVPAKDAERIAAEFKKKYNQDYYFFRANTALLMVAEAMKRAKSVDPKAVAKTLEGMRFTTELGDVEMRTADHQLIQPLYISTIERTAAKGGPKDVRHDIENSGMGFRTDAKIDGWMSAQPTSCQMKRP
jgi:branched-chain amino acid transport system substrate-binding protein